MTHFELMMRYQDALDKHQHYLDKGWYKIAWDYWTNKVIPLYIKIILN